MVRVAVQNPTCIFADQARNFNGYNYKFIEKYCGTIFVPRLRNVPKYLKRLHDLGWSDKKVCVSAKKLNRLADVLVCFNGRAYAPGSQPPREFHGLKVFHVMDYSDQTSALHKALTAGNADYLMGYCRHDRYSGFFQHHFPEYNGKVIGVPFGYGERFINKVPFESRINKCIALGSVNPVSDPLMEPGHLEDYIAYYHEHMYSHELRKAIVDHLEEWNPYFDSRLPVPPETKNPGYDAVEELNNYTMFINDECIDNFPPARTYEGIACGAVMVCTDSPIYAELGFCDGVNCIMFRKGDYDDMLKKIAYYMEHSGELKQIQENSLHLAGEYSHQKVADRLFDEICALAKEK